MSIFRKTLIAAMLLGIFYLEGYEPITVNGVTYDDQTVANLITVITVTSPIKSMPNVDHIYPAQASLFQVPALALCKKIIVFDGIRPGQEALYEKTYPAYKEKLLELTRTDPYFANTQLVFCSEWKHLTKCIQEGLKHVKTPFIYLHQHDLQLLKGFDLNGLIASMVVNPNLQCVMLSGGINEGAACYHTQVDKKIEGKHFVPIIRCFGWSDQAQISTVDYYYNVVFPQCLAHKGSFMEQVMLHRLRYDFNELGDDVTHPVYKTYLYGNWDDGSYILHSDGKNN